MAASCIHVDTRVHSLRCFCVYDRALIRPGRFDSKVIITMPDVKARYDILKVHVKDIPLSKGKRK